MTRQTERVEERLKVTLNKGYAVAGSSPHPAEIIFQIGKRTYPSAQFYDRSPQCGREMEPYQATPAQHSQPAEEHKEHKGGMEQNNHVSPKTVVHPMAPQFQAQHALQPFHDDRTCAGTEIVLHIHFQSCRCEDSWGISPCERICREADTSLSPSRSADQRDKANRTEFFVAVVMFADPAHSDQHLHDRV